MNNGDIFHTLALLLVKKIGPRIYQRLTQNVSSTEIFNLNEENLKNIGLSNPETLYQILYKKTYPQTEFILKKCKDEGINLITIEDPNYPFLLKQCGDAPILLYYKGILPDKTKSMLSIVGSRIVTSYGKQIIANWFEVLANYPIHIVSGLAYGIDYWAHYNAIKYQLPTTGVLANGLDTIYPEEHKNIAHNILDKGGCLLSETPPTKSIEKGYFPKRNRIIAGISRAVWVVESAKRGGALITAQFASDYDREVLALAGKVTDSQSQGCNELINKNIAELALDPSTILKALRLDKENKLENKLEKTPIIQKITPTLTELQKTIQQLLHKHHILHLEEISQYLGLSSHIMAQELMFLELQNIVKSLSGQRFELK